MLNKLHVYERFWTCLCSDKFHNIQEGEYCYDCLHELISDTHCTYIIKRTKIDPRNCSCSMPDGEYLGCMRCKPDDYIFNEKTLSYDKK